MARIPLYDQQQLASQMVGTPGVDRSGAQMFSSLAQAAGGLGDQISRTQYYNKINERKALEAQKKLEAAQTKALDDVDYANAMIELTRQIGEEEQSIKTDYQNDPVGIDKVFQESSTRILDAYAESVSNPRVAQRLKVGGAEYIKNRTTGMIQDYIPSQRTKIAQAKTGEALRGLVGEAGQAADYKTYLETRGKLDAMQSTMALSYGADASKNYDETRKAMAKSYLNSQMVKDPTSVKALIESNEFDDDLQSGDARQQLIFRAESQIKMQEREIKQAHQEEALRRRTDDIGFAAGVDEDNTQALSEADAYWKKRLEEEQSLPPERQNVTNLEYINRQSRRTTKAIENYGTDAAEKARKEAAAVLASPASSAIRVKLDDHEISIEAKKSNEGYANKAEMEKDLAKYEAELHAAHKKGALSAPQLAAGMHFINKSRAELKYTEEAKRPLDLRKTITDTWNAFFGPKSPKPNPKAHDAAIQTYKGALNELVERHKARNNGVAPTGAKLIQYQNLAKQRAAQAAGAH